MPIVMATCHVAMSWPRMRGGAISEMYSGCQRTAHKAKPSVSQAHRFQLGSGGPSPRSWGSGSRPLQIES
eukprot:2774076-Prymnesium_polylepis.1